jgi:osmotically-inducible protein OsmY
MAEDTLGQRIMDAIQQQTHQRIVAAATDDRVILSGVVPSHHLRDHSATIAASLAGGLWIENEIEVENTLTPGTDAYPSADRSATGWDADTTQNEYVSDNDPDSMAQPLDSNPDDIPNDSVYDEEDSPEPDPTYFAPTDPVIMADARGNAAVVNGFASTADDDLRRDDATLDGAPGDEALADAITEELRRDAATTDLAITVTVIDGVAHLTGTVPDMADAANAEDVAGRIPGIRDVVEDLDIAQLG